MFRIQTLSAGPSDRTLSSIPSTEKKRGGGEGRGRKQPVPELERKNRCVGLEGSNFKNNAAGLEKQFAAKSTGCSFRGSGFNSQY